MGSFAAQTTVSLYVMWAMSCWRISEHVYDSYDLKIKYLTADDTTLI